MLDCLLGGNDKKRWFSVDSNVLEKKQWHLCRLASPASSASAFGSSDFTSSTPSMVALMCMELWNASVGLLISLPKNRLGNGMSPPSSPRFRHARNKDSPPISMD